VIVSAVFPSESPSAGAALGVLRLASIVRDTPAPVYALGGVDGLTVRRLGGTGVAGVAAVSALA
jgi:thiamine-phosphate pyrophosphorylase